MTEVDEASYPTGLTTEPAFQSEADKIAAAMSRYSADELGSMLKVNRKIAVENYGRWRDFFIPSLRRPAVMAYDGMVFKKIAPETMSANDLVYANGHLNICSFLYGLLRPMDLISAYRLEGNVEIEGVTGGKSVAESWRDTLTDYLIEKTKGDDGVLVNLASDEMKGLFNWKRIEKELKVVRPEFKVEKDGKLKSIVIYAKMCRGAMTSYILRNRVSDPGELSGFSYDGFEFRSQSPSGTMLFVMQ